jgi:hypothetical protein
MRFYSFLKLAFLSLVLVSTALQANTKISPSLWQIEKNGVTSYMLGTVHLGDQEMAGLPNYVTDAIKKTDKLFVEVDLSKIDPMMQQQVVMQYMMLPEGKTLQSELSPESYQALGNYFSKAGLDIALFKGLQPFAVLLQITIMEYQKAGYVDTFGIDKQVMAVAQQSDIPVLQLETLEQQMKMLTSFSQYNDVMVKDSLSELADMDKYFNRLIGSWKRGDDAALESYYRETFTGDSYSALTESVLLTDRNNNWALQLENKLTKEPHFIAVGALHLYGPEGMLALLKKQGFKLTKTHG